MIQSMGKPSHLIGYDLFLRKGSKMAHDQQDDALSTIRKHEALRTELFQR